MEGPRVARKRDYNGAAHHPVEGLSILPWKDQASSHGGAEHPSVERPSIIPQKGQASCHGKTEHPFMERLSIVPLRDRASSHRRTEHPSTQELSLTPLKFRGRARIGSYLCRYLQGWDERHSFGPDRIFWSLNPLPRSDCLLYLALKVNKPIFNHKQRKYGPDISLIT